MEDFRGVLMVLGGLAIAGLVIHGIWTVRKNDKKHQVEEGVELEVEDEIVEKDNKLSKKFSLKEKLSTDTQEQNKTRVEPNLDGHVDVPSDDDQLQIKLPEEDIKPLVATQDDEPVVEVEQEKAAETTETKVNTEAGQPEEVLILNVMAAEGQQISGASLLPFLLTLGFKYGEMKIFHRHEDSAGSGDVLFSLANMFNPGTFDIDNMETFSTQGLSLFMSLPVTGDPNQVFNMMHNAAKKLAAEFNGQVLDGQRSVLTSQTVQHYKERIREFERRQLLK
ncbi:cell division protein ZipA [Catenovulum sp. SM1970]|uniref:cell division protein ZipA n=1 Tax=Marinifaba aquimaris TaxID=2741323 RepID=UPI00157185D9|nr:cell division protein ZipA [Marinifaba aquimaris]NTS77368.1 cell division protein ZipA [Marinifaba aquimaris]